MMRTVVVFGLGLALPAVAFVAVLQIASPHLPKEVQISHVEGSPDPRVLTLQEFTLLPLSLRDAILVAIDTGFASVDADATIARAVRDLGATGATSLVV